MKILKGIKFVGITILLTGLTIDLDTSFNYAVLFMLIGAVLTGAGVLIERMFTYEEADDYSACMRSDNRNR